MIGGHQPESSARGWLLEPACVQLVLAGGVPIAVEVPPRRLLTVGVDGRQVAVWFDPVGRVVGGVVRPVVSVQVDGAEVRDA